MKKTIRIILPAIIILAAVIAIALPLNVKADSKRKPAVITDREGYLPDEEKTVFFIKGPNVENEMFYVVDSKTRDTVLAGTMISYFTDEDGKEVLSGDFTAVKEEGEYYIEAPRIGRSYTFRIGNEVAGKKEEKILKSIKKNIRTSYFDASRTLLWLARCEEKYGKEEEIASLEEEADAYLHDIKKGTVSANDADRKSDPIRDEAYYCAAEAAYGKVLEDRKEGSGREHIAEAEKAYNGVLKYLDDNDELSFNERRLKYFIAAEMFKATGDKKYSEAFLEFYESLKDKPGNINDDAYVYGSIAYLSTKGDTDNKVCEVLIGELISAARNYCDEVYDNKYFLITDEKHKDEMARRLYIICVIEQTIVSKEYVGTMGYTMHYIDGTAYEADRGDIGAFLYVAKEITEREATQ